MSNLPGPPFFALMRSEARCQPTDDDEVRNETQINRHGILNIHVLKQELFIKQVSHFQTQETAALAQPLADGGVGGDEVFPVFAESGRGCQINFLVHKTRTDFCK